MSAAHHVEFHDSLPYHIYSLGTTGAFPEDFYFLGLIWIFLLCLELLTGISILGIDTYEPVNVRINKTKLFLFEASFVEKHYNWPHK